MAYAAATLNKFSPHPERFGMGSLGIAFLAHGFLIAALTWGTTWRSDNTLVTASAELWAELPVQAAPTLVEAPPPIDTAIDEHAEIVTKKAKANKKREHEAERQLELIRQDNLKRMAGLAGATGPSSSTGSALQNAAPSASYEGLLKAKVKPNILFPDVSVIQGNPPVEINIRLAPDGTIMLPLQITKSSGYAAFDRAVVRGLEKTEILPRDKDGRFPTPFTLVWRPKE